MAEWATGSQKKASVCVEESDKVCLHFKQSANRRQGNSVSFILMVLDNMVLFNS